MAPDDSLVIRSADSIIEDSRTKKRDRPSGNIKTVKFNGVDGMSALADTATLRDHPRWDWDGKSYPKTKWSRNPNCESLDDHGDVLVELIGLAPNGYPDPYRLKDLLIHMHDIFKVFPSDDSAESKMS